MPESSTIQSGLPDNTDYYAPDFKVEVEGKELPQESIGDILEVKVTMDMENLTSFDFTVNNWDSDLFEFKYSDCNTFDVGNRVHVQMGYAGKLVSMAYGVISSLTPRFSESGPPTIGVSGLDSMINLRGNKPKQGEEKIYKQKTFCEIAEQVSKRHPLQFKGTNDGLKPIEVVVQTQDDAQFLMWMAKQIDFDSYVKVDPKTKKDKLFFVKPTDGRDGGKTRVYVFEWGMNLINFSPQLSVAKQVSKVTVRGWDPTTKSSFSYTAGKDDLPNINKGGTSGPAKAEKTLGDKQDMVVDMLVTSPQEAKDLATSLLRERAYDFITGTGQVIGIPDLRPGDTVELLKLGQRFSGVYYVEKVEHTLGSSGYRTQFSVRKPFDGGTKKCRRNQEV